jgi:hypothetical protein
LHIAVGLQGDDLLELRPHDLHREVRGLSGVQLTEEPVRVAVPVATCAGSSTAGPSPHRITGNGLADDPGDSLELLTLETVSMPRHDAVGTRARTAVLALRNDEVAGEVASYAVVPDLSILRAPAATTAGTWNRDAAAVRSV